MPKQTFFNLTEEKQKQIVDAAISEFSQSSFNEVKISDIISRAKIPRSSFYDYFEDKQDLYKYIVLMIREEKMKYLDPVFAKHYNGLFEKLRMLFKAGVKFASAKPEYESLMNKTYENVQQVKDILGIEEIDVSNIFEPMLMEGLRNGEIRTDIDIEFAAKAISILSTNLTINYIKKQKGNPREYIDEIADKIIDFIKFGISNN